MAERSTTVRVRVSPGASRSEFVGPHGPSLVAGHGAREKVVALEGLDQSEVTRRLRDAGGP